LEIIPVYLLYSTKSEAESDDKKMECLGGWIPCTTAK